MWIRSSAEGMLIADRIEVADPVMFHVQRVHDMKKKSVEVAKLIHTF